MIKWPLITISLVILLLVSNGIVGYLLYFVIKVPDLLRHFLQIITFVSTGIIFKKYLNKNNLSLDSSNMSKDKLGKLEDKPIFNFKSNSNMNNKLEKMCPYCAEMIKWKAKKCRYCGEWLNI